MKIVIEKSTNSDGFEVQDMSIDGNHVLCVFPLNDTTATIGEDLVSCIDIVEYMKQAFQAGKRGEKLEVFVMTTDY